MSRNPPSPRPVRQTRWAFRLLAIAALPGLLVLFEFALRIIEPDFLGGREPVKISPAGLPYFHVAKADGAQIYTPSQYFLPWGHHFKLVMPKPPGVFRVFSLGESTTNGGAFGNPGAYSRWLGLELAAADPSAAYEVINSGQGGYPASLVLTLEEQVLAANPDLLIVYSGNNEFFFHRAQTNTRALPPWLLELKYRLQQTRTLRLIAILGRDRGREEARSPTDPDAMQDHAARYLAKAIADPWDRNHRDLVLAQYRRDLEAMIKLARERGVRIILCTVVANLRDYAPYGSDHRPDLTATARAEWDRLVAEGRAAYLRGDFESSRASFVKALAMDDTPAELNFYLAHCLLRLGRPADAAPYFQAAVDRDPVRDRVGSDLNAIVREVAAANQVPLADIAEIFRRRAPDGVPGDDLFVDNVHPTLEGHRLIAESLLRVMIAQGLAKPGPGWEDRAAKANETYEKIMPPDYLYNCYYTAASLNAFLGRFARARRWAIEALKYSPTRTEGQELKFCLDTILSRPGPDPSLPWAELERARGRTASAN